VLGGAKLFIFGTRRKDKLTGTNSFDLVLAGSGADTINTLGGNDLIFAGSGRDIINAGSGSDIVFGGKGRDHFVHVVSENVGARDYYSGGRGKDTLELVLTEDQASNSALMAEIQAFRDRPKYSTWRDFKFESIGLTVSSVENLVVKIIGPISNSAPIVTPLTEGIGEDTANAAFDLLAGAADPDEDRLTIVDLALEITTQGGRTLFSGIDYTLGNGGQFLTLTASGIAKFNDLADGTTDRIVFGFNVSDGTDAVSNTLTVVVTGANDAAQISGETAGAVVEDATLIATGLLSVIDPDAGENEVFPQTDALGTYGSFSITSEGRWAYELNNSAANVQALTETDTVYDIFTVTSVDGTTQTKVQITISGAVEAAVNLAPTAVDDIFDGSEDAEINGDVLINDTDPEDDDLTAVLLSGPAQGTLEWAGDGTFTYNPTENFNGNVSFTYASSDGNLESDVATVTLRIAAKNDDPAVAGALLLEAVEDGGLQSVDLLAGASDVDAGDVLAIENLSALPSGLSVVGTTLSVNPADLAFQSLSTNGEARFELTYDVVDGNGGRTPQTVTVAVAGVNDDPAVAGALLLEAIEDGGLQSVDLLAGASDVDAGDVLAIENVTGLIKGVTVEGTTLTLDPSNSVFDPLNDGDSADILISYDIIDGNGGRAAQTATISVQGVSDLLPPSVPSLFIAASDRTAPGETQAARVTLVGQTSPGAIVELRSPDGTALLSEVLANNNGAFRIPDVALSVGSTNFQVIARDPVSGLESLTDGVSFDRVTPPADAPANAVLFWIDAALETLADSGTTPDYASRGLAMQSIAVQNTLAAINGDDGYLFSFEGEDADADMAVAYAAHGILRGIYAGQGQALDTRLADYLTQVSTGVDPSAAVAAQSLGEAVAARVLGFRKDDGWDTNEIFIGSNEDGQWRPTGPSYFNAQNPHWGDLEPFTLETGEQFRPDAPPSVLSDTITDDAYANDLERVRALGESDSTERTADQTQIARYWAAGAGTETPPGHWNRIAKQISEDEGLSLSQAADVMLKLNLAMSDSAIAAWDTKFAYDFWRPVTILSKGGVDSGTTILADPDWAPLLTTPAHPEYVSGHSTYSGAAATILTEVFGDGYIFSDTAETTSGDITRSFASFWDAANEGGESRVFGGIHFDFSNQTGLELGTDVANWVLQSFDPLNDTVAPTITLLNLDIDGVNAPPQIEGILTDNLSGALSLLAVLNGTTYVDVPVDALGGFSFNTGVLPEGDNTVSFIAQDAAANTRLLNYDFFLSSIAPAVTLEDSSISDTNTGLAPGARIAGDVGLPSGIQIAALTVQIGAGPVRPLTFDNDGKFDALLEIGALDPGAQVITLRVADTAGNETVKVINADLAERPPFQILDLQPGDREVEVGSTVHPLVQFSRAVDLTTLDSDSFYAVTATGEKVSATITPLNDGTGAWMFFTNPLPGSTAIELVVDGDLIRAADGAALDGDADGIAGGQAVQRFTTVALEGLESTTLVGRVSDPGADLFMMTPDDFIAGPGGITDYANHIYRSPIENAEVYVLGRPDLKVFTDETGAFELTGLPTGRVKIVVDGRTATNAPTDFYWPEMVLDVEIRPGQQNTIMGGMGPLEAQLERQEDQAFFLPRIPEAAVSPASDTEVTVVRPVSAAGTNLTPEQFDLIQLEVQPGSMVDAQGNPIANPQLGLALVPSEMVIDMLPDGVPTPPIFLTIQGPDGGVFTEEAVLTIPNVFGLAPGAKTEFFSYDHQTGLLVINGVGTVSEDGTFIKTDPGSGILQPGWNGPVAISRILIDPQLPCPPGTTHPENTGPAPDGPTASEAAEALSATDRFIRDKYGEIGDDSSIFVNNFLSDFYRQAEAKLAVDMEIMANAAIAGDSGPIGGPVDAGFWGIMGTKFVGDIAETTVKSAANLTPLKLWVSKLKLLAINEVIEFSQEMADVQFPGEAAQLADVQTRAQNIADNGISGKFGGGTPKSQPFQILADEASEAAEQIQELAQKWEQQQEQHRQLAEKTTELKDNFGDLLEKLERGETPTIQEIEQLAGPANSDPTEGPLLQLLEEINTITRDIEQTGTMLGTIVEMHQVLQDIGALEDDLLGETQDTISLADLSVPPSQVEGEYEISYGPVQYVLLTNLDTGEEQRFTMKSGELPLQPTSPGANYQIEIFDPVSGFSGASNFLAPRPFVVDSRTSLILLPRVEPIIRPTPGEPIGPGGLTESQAHIVGADFDAKDSLLPGTNITDRQALISGLGSSPGSVNLNGVTGRLPLDGTAEAVAIGGTAANGADLMAYVATGDLGLALVSVAESTQPILLGQIDLPGFAEDVAVVDRLNLVAVALGDGGLAVVNVRDAVRPQIDAIYEDLTVTQVIAIDDRLVVAKDGRVKLIDAASGVELASVGVGVGPDQQFEALAYEDGQIYALGDNGTLHVVSIDGTTLENRGLIDVSARLRDLPDSPQIATQDGILWIGSQEQGGSNRGGMLTVDTTNPDVPTVVADFNLTNLTGDFAGNSVGLNGSGFGVHSKVRFDNGSNSESRLIVFNSRDPSDIQNEVTEYRFEGQTKDIAIAAGEAFLATGREGLQIVRFLGIDTQGNAPTIAISALPDDVDDAVDGMQVFQGQTLKFDVSTDDDIQVRSVEVLINGNVILSTVTFPWDLTVTLPTIADLGTDILDVQFRATDTGGNATITDAVQVQMVEDITPFTIVSVSPEDGADLLPGAVRSITVEFSKSVESDTVSADTFMLKGPSGPIAPASISVRDSGTEVQLTYLATAFASGAFTLTIDADNVTDRAGTNLSAADLTTSFSIQTVSGQTWISTSDGTWNDPVNWASGLVPQAGDDVVVPLSVGVTATISAAAPDANSVTVSGDGTLRFNTADGDDLTTETLSNTGNIDVGRGDFTVTTQTVNAGLLEVSSGLGTLTNGQTINFAGNLFLNGPLTNNGTLQVSEGGNINLTNTPQIDNQGEIVLIGTPGGFAASSIRTSGALTELTGGGTVRFETGTDAIAPGFNGGVNSAFLGVIDETFRNVDNLITGSGRIGAGFVFENATDGQIVAGNGDTLKINPGRLVNTGTVEAQSGGVLNISSDQFGNSGGIFGFKIATKVDNLGGEIVANGGQINLTDSTISGGLLKTENGGLMTIGSSGGNAFARMDGLGSEVTIEGQLIGTSFLQTSGTINNTGFLTTSIGSFGTQIQIIDSTTFTGGGSINLFSRDVGTPDEVVSSIFNDYSVLFDDETGEQVFDEFGQLVLENETFLTLQDQDIRGAGRIGTSEDEGEFGTQPLFQIEMFNGSEIRADESGNTLELLNTNVSVFDGTLSASSGGILEFIDSDIFNFGTIDVQGGGEMRFEFGERASFGGYLYSEGDINVFDGDFYSEFFLFNRGNFNVFGGSAEVSSMTDDAASGGITQVGDAQLLIQNGGSSTLDTSFGDAELIVQDTFNFAPTLIDFEAGDKLHLEDFDAFTTTATFVGGGQSGLLTLDDGFNVLELELLSSIGDFTGVTENDFLVSDSFDFGGLLLETTLIFG